MKDFRTTIYGAVAGISLLLHNQGISFGHIGSGDFISLIGAIATILLGYHAVDKAKISGV